MEFLDTPMRLDKAMKDPMCKKYPNKGCGQLYEIRNIENNKGYIGLSTTDLYTRLYHHLRKKSGCLYIRNALQKHGTAAFTVQLIQKNIPLDDLPNIETKSIFERETMFPKGYNICIGGKTSPMKSDHVRAKQKQTRSTKEYHLLQSNVSKEVGSRPEVIKKRSESMIKVCKLNKEQRSNSARVAMNRPEVKERHRNALKQSHNTDQYRANASLAQKINQNRPEVVAKKSKAIKKAHADPEVKERHRLAIKRAFSTPEARANRKAAQKERAKRESKETKEKRIAAFKATMKRKKEMLSRVQVA